MNTAFCFDLDGTITKEEILPLIASEVNLQEEIRTLTLATIQGIIPFRSSFLLRCKLLDDVPLSRIQEIVRDIPLYGEIEAFIRMHRENCYVVTGNLDLWIEPLREKLACKFHSSAANASADRLVQVETIVDKGAIVRDLRAKYENVVAIGDGMGDVAMFENADTCIAFGATHDPIQTLIEFATHVIYDEVALCRFLNTL